MLWVNPKTTMSFPIRLFGHGRKSELRIVLTLPCVKYWNRAGAFV
ncbi:hypothetical protein COO91_10871 (plasmid) [Nostoc flagelliforme CCNUN1]|uniref:Uncharacterized protein n=1 Tax=Nostoc flagelliforme CCNUN1 TaxID=2038116 RepID=A0A2K8TAL8_9NOSO|nr:hypothetical protein COO91_10871 [Nostoc flagelliforme CCNUN1]